MSRKLTTKPSTKVTCSATTNDLIAYMAAQQGLLTDVLHEVKRDIDEFVRTDEFKRRSDLDPTRDSVDKLIDNVREECKKLVDQQLELTVGPEGQEWLNKDDNYSVALGDAVRIK